MRGRAVLLLLVAALLAGGCRGDRPTPAAPPTSPDPATSAQPTTTAARVPNLTADPIAGLDPATLHGKLVTLGFTTGASTTLPGLVTTTSQRRGATVSTYGKGPTDVVKIVAEADRAAALPVLAAVATTAIKGRDAKKAEGWVKAELAKKGAISPTEPRAAMATYGGQPYALLVTTTTATLSIGRLTR